MSYRRVKDHSGNMLKVMRLEMKKIDSRITAKKLAKKAEINPKTYEHIENLSQRCSYQKACKIKNALNELRETYGLGKIDSVEELGILIA